MRIRFFDCATACSTRVPIRTKTIGTNFRTNPSLTLGCCPSCEPLSDLQNELCARSAILEEQAIHVRDPTHARRGWRQRLNIHFDRALHRHRFNPPSGFVLRISVTFIRCDSDF